MKICKTKLKYWSESKLNTFMNTYTVHIYFFFQKKKNKIYLLGHKLLFFFSKSMSLDLSFSNNNKKKINFVNYNFLKIVIA